MKKRYFLEVRIKQLIKIKKLKRKMLLAFSLFVLPQLVFADQVFAFPLNNSTINHTTSQSILSGSLSFKENIPVTGVTLNKSSLTLKVKKSATLIASVIPSNATDKTVYWDSSNFSIAKVDDGKVVGVRPGTALITASTEDGNMTAVCEVEVINPDIVTFEDANLEEVVRDSIEKPTGDILKSDVKSITALDARNKSITNLNGIENLIYLKRLDLSSNQIDDISNLESLTRLTTLNLNNNQSIDLEIIANIKSLTSLNLSGDQIDDISPLEALTKLKSLNLNNNQIVDILSIKKLTRLTNLYLAQNQISNINPLRASTKLKYLDLSQNQINDSAKRSLRNALPKCKLIF